MDTKKSVSQKQKPSPVVVRYDAEAIANMALAVKAAGFVPAEDIKTQFGPESFTKGIAVLLERRTDRTVLWEPDRVRDRVGTARGEHGANIMTDFELAIAILHAEIQVCLADEQSDAAHYRRQGMARAEADERSKASYAPFHLLKSIQACSVLATASASIAWAVAGRRGRGRQGQPMTDDLEHTIECPCCGCEAWIGTEVDIIVDGTPLLCGCRGHISCDSETEPYAVADDCGCQEPSV